jgi:hypothetical protein
LHTTPPPPPTNTTQQPKTTKKLKQFQKTPNKPKTKQLSSPLDSPWVWSFEEALLSLLMKILYNLVS